MALLLVLFAATAATASVTFDVNVVQVGTSRWQPEPESEPPVAPAREATGESDALDVLLHDLSRPDDRDVSALLRVRRTRPSTPGAAQPWPRERPSDDRTVARFGSVVLASAPPEPLGTAGNPMLVPITVGLLASGAGCLLLVGLARTSSA